jgi:hypothetical protein
MMEMKLVRKLMIMLMIIDRILAMMIYVITMKVTKEKSLHFFFVIFSTTNHNNAEAQK